MYCSLNFTSKEMKKLKLIFVFSLEIFFICTLTVDSKSFCWYNYNSNEYYKPSLLTFIFPNYRF